MIQNIFHEKLTFPVFFWLIVKTSVLPGSNGLSLSSDAFKAIFSSLQRIPLILRLGSIKSFNRFIHYTLSYTGDA